MHNFKPTQYEMHEYKVLRHNDVRTKQHLDEIFYTPVTLC
jgi:hypothetical protein